LESTYPKKNKERIITNITLAITLEINGYLENRKEDTIGDLAIDFKNIMRSPKNLAFIAVLLNMKDYVGKKTPEFEEFNKQIAGFLKDKAEFHLSQPTLSKTLIKLEKNGLLNRIKGKQNIKTKFPDLYSRGRGKSEKKSGFPVVYKFTDNVIDYVKVLDDPKALERINQNLSSYNELLCKFYQAAFSDMLDLIAENRDPLIFELFSLSTKPLAKSQIPTESDWTLFRTELAKISKVERERHANDMANSLLQNPQSKLFFLFCLTQKKYEG
jgi:hypothetical protein